MSFTDFTYVSKIPNCYMCDGHLVKAWCEDEVSFSSTPRYLCRAHWSKYGTTSNPLVLRLRGSVHA